MAWYRGRHATALAEPPLPEVDGPSPATAEDRVREAAKRRGWRTSPLYKNKAYLFALVVVAAIVAVGVLAPVLAPYPPNRPDLASSLSAPSHDHLLGTDKQGRDILSRLIWGTRTTLLSALFVVFISEIIGVPLGLVAGYFGGWVDALIMRAWDVLLGFPALLLAFVIVAVFGRGLTNAVIALGIVYVPMISRIVRGVVLVQRELTYVEAARAIGAGHLRVLGHILRNSLSPILVQSTIDLGYAILDLAALSYLGLGVQPPTADWGAMLADGREYLILSPYTAVASGLAIMLAVVAFNLLGDGLQAHFDPKRRR
ncbi:MAG: ABC transporter permease [Clostridia bacterium]|nr:ABC transporter permease [Clostridia bacterium]